MFEKFKAYHQGKLITYIRLQDLRINLVYRGLEIRGTTVDLRVLEIFEKNQVNMMIPDVKHGL